MSNPPPIKNEETPTTDTLLARWWVRGSWKYLFRRRQKLGVARYGTPLQPFNGRDAILDASEEFQDATVYAEQCIREGRLPVAVGAMVQLLCLFALRVLWYYAGVATQERIVGLARTDVGDEVRNTWRRKWGMSPLEPTEMPRKALHQNPEKWGTTLSTGPGPCPILVGTYDPPDSQSDSWGLEPLESAEDMPTLHLRAVVPPIAWMHWQEESVAALKRSIARTHTEESAVEDNALETEVEEAPEQEKIQGFWSKNGPVYNDVPSWQWVGPSNNRGYSASRLLNHIWEDRLRSENASEA